MTVMIRSENRKNYKFAVIVSHLFFPQTEKLIICVSSWLQLNKKGGHLACKYKMWDRHLACQ
jgi:hypothetical protein